MGKGLGIAAFVLVLISVPIPVLGSYLCLFALILAAIAAFSGDKTWPIVSSIVGGINLFFLSPSWMFMMYSHKLVEGVGPFGDAVTASQKSTNTFYFYLTLFIVALPIGVVVFKSLSGSASEVLPGENQS